MTVSGLARRELDCHHHHRPVMLLLLIATTPRYLAGRPLLVGRVGREAALQGLDVRGEEARKLGNLGHVRVGRPLLQDSHHEGRRPKPLSSIHGDLWQRIASLIPHLWRCMDCSAPHLLRPRGPSLRPLLLGRYTRPRLAPRTVTAVSCTSTAAALPCINDSSRRPISMSVVTTGPPHAAIYTVLPAIVVQRSHIWVVLEGRIHHDLPHSGPLATTFSGPGSDPDEQRLDAAICTVCDEMHHRGVSCLTGQRFHVVVRVHDPATQVQLFAQRLNVSPEPAALDLAAHVDVHGQSPIVRIPHGREAGQSGIVEDRVIQPVVDGPGRN